MNKALLVSQAWRIYNSKSSLIKNLYLAKYKTDPLTTGISNRIPSNSSLAFRSLCKATSSVKQGFRKNIGNGRDTHIFNDKWVGNEKIRESDLKCQATNTISKVSEIISNNQWNAHIIWNTFKRNTAKEILAYTLPHTPRGDFYYWGESKKGYYSVRSGYKELQNSTNMEITNKNDFWKKFWKLNICPKWKIFIWRVINRAIPTALSLRKRKIQVDRECKFCQSQPESLEHLFRDCQFSNRIWMVTMGIKPLIGAHVKIGDWIMNFINLIKKKDAEMRDAEIQDENKEDNVETFIITLWAIWMHRNEIIFKFSSPNPRRIVGIFE